MNEELLEKIKKIILIALASDDYLMATLVLKGGNAIQLGHGVNKRGSFDIDYSIESDFEDVKEAESRIFKTLTNTFSEYGYVVFDLTFKAKPNDLSPALQSFWGGYKVGFKICDKSVYDNFNGVIDNDNLRRKAIALHPKTRSTNLEIEISKHEYIKHRQSVDIDGYTIYIYAPIMIVFEKMRAICQQNDEYSTIIYTRTQRERAKDFYDIYVLVEDFELDIFASEYRDMIKYIFAAKKVPLEYMSLVPNYKEKHAAGFQTVKSTISQSQDSKSFDFYFEYVMNLFEKLKITLEIL